MLSNRRIRPADYRPPELRGRRLRGPRPVVFAALAAAAVAATGLWFVLTLRAVEITTVPPADEVALSGATFRLAGNWLARPGEYTFTAEHPGFRELREPVAVPASGAAKFEFELEPLPGKLRFETEPSDAEVRIDGEPVGRTPLAGVELAGGEYELELVREDYLAHRARLEVEGKGAEQTVAIELQPDSAPVSVATVPPGARILVDGNELGTAPATVELDHGEHNLALALDGFATWSETIVVTGGEPLELPPVELEPAAATVRVVSEPPGASVSVDGNRRGTAPVTLDLAPGEPATIRLELPGHEPLARTVTPAPGTERTLTGELVPIDARLVVYSDPPGAELFVDGRAAGTIGEDGLELELPARDYRIAARLDGYLEQTARVDLDPDQPRSHRFEMQTELEARLARLQPLIRAADGQSLRLVEPGSFTMGSARGEQGRRANELHRPVALDRLFYLGLHEVTNEQFRRFRPNHSSGIIGERTLDNEEQPVVRVDFDDIAAFCNWLSEREELEPAYRRTASGYVLKRPVTQGYRLPTEAEWAWVARFAGGRELKYPWPGGMPPPLGAGNFAGREAAGLVPVVLDGYDDGNPATALVGSFDSNALGYFDLGGNVSEWTGDYYAIELKQMFERVTDPLGPTGGTERVVRGSSWRHAGITELRLAWRDRADSGRDDLGFRIARYAEPPRSARDAP